MILLALYNLEYMLTVVLTVDKHTTAVLSSNEVTVPRCDLASAIQPEIYVNCYSTDSRQAYYSATPNLTLSRKVANMQCCDSYRERVYIPHDVLKYII